MNTYAHKLAEGRKFWNMFRKYLDELYPKSAKAENFQKYLEKCEKNTYA